ncbi:MAG: helix-turn-helix domain-containing protein, partial [Eubacterium sp.]
LRVTVATLRKKLALQASLANIQTHVGIGYRMMRAE